MKLIDLNFENIYIYIIYLFMYWRYIEIYYDIVNLSCE